MRILLVALLVFGVSFMACAQDTWSVARGVSKGKPVVYKFIDPVPPESTRQKLPWLAVISWRYDDSENDGMPSAKTNQAMIELEDALETIKNRGELYLDVYSGTGNQLKEFAFYIADREAFMANFNDALGNRPHYPIEIHFYEDREWTDLARLHRNVGVAWQ